MAIELKMPVLSPAMEKGTLANWLVTEGDEVKAGDVLAEVETDKATMEIEADSEGRVARLLVTAGTEDVPVGTAIALMAAEDEGLSEPAAAQRATAVSQSESATEPVPELAPSPTSSSTLVPTTPAPSAPTDSSVNASPLARRIAAIRNLALDAVSGSGPSGKILRTDLGIPSLAADARPACEAQFQPISAVAAPPEGISFEAVKLSSMRKTTARRLTQSKTQVPHFYLTKRCNLDRLLALRGDLNASLEASGLKLSVDDMLMKALAMALIKVPEANVQFGGEVLYRFDRVDVAMAVAVEGGLVTPVIRDVGSLSLSAIARRSKELATKARDGKLASEDYQGGTVSMSNLGMFGIDEIFPVLNPPQALILGIGAGVEQPWSVRGEIEPVTIKVATASFDHRAINGAVGAQFLAEFHRVVEQPLTILC